MSEAWNMSSATSKPQRYTPENPCPVCKGYESAPREQGIRCHGYVAGGGRTAYCAREKYARGVQFDEKKSAYVHRLQGECECGVVHKPVTTPPDVNGKEKARTRKRVAARWTYEDENRKPYMRVNRLDLFDEKGNPLLRQHGKPQKTFFQERFEKKTWKKGLANRPPILYRLPELQEADPSLPVLIPEGEKHVDRLWADGFVATCNPMGAGKWRDEYSQHPRNRDCVLLADNDEAGRRHVAQVARSLLGIAASVKIVELPGLPENGDVLDWLDSGHSCEELQAIIDETPTLTDLPKCSESPGSRETASISGGEPRIQTGFKLTEIGNAERFVARHGRNVRYVHVWKAWLIWDGTRWKIDDSGKVRQLAKETVRSIYDEAKEESDDGKRAKIAKHAASSAREKHITAVLKLAESDVPVAVGQLDAKPWLFNVTNRTIDLRTDVLNKHRREDLLTKCAPVTFDHMATCPRWLEFLNKIMEGNQELIAYLQRALGSTLVGENRDQKIFICHGQGANGKSTLLEVIRSVFGDDYARQASFETFLSKNAAHGGGPRPDLARLAGVRFVSATEAEEGRWLSPVTVKQLTGGDRVTARFLYGSEFEFVPQFNIWLATNHKPVIRQNDLAIWRRIDLIPFEVTIPEDERDPNLIENLRKELPGILAWLLAGCQMWLDRGLQTPKEVSVATEDYRSENDYVGRFIEECCECGPNFCTHASELLARYKEWAERNGEPINVTAQKFALRLKEHDLTNVKTGGRKVWQGVKIRDG